MNATDNAVLRNAIRRRMETQRKLVRQPDDLEARYTMPPIYLTRTGTRSRSSIRRVVMEPHGSDPLMVCTLALRPARESVWNMRAELEVLIFRLRQSGFTCILQWSAEIQGMPF